MVIDPTSTKILITGANGFIGLHTVLHFLRLGYNLCATVRTQEQGEKVRQTLAKHTDTQKLEFAYADLTKDGGWDQAAAGKRFIANGASIPLQEFAFILDRNFASRGYRVPVRVLPDWIVRFFAIFIPKTKPVVDTLGWDYSLSTEEAQSVLEWDARPYEGTIIEMAQSMIEQGMV